MDIHALTCYGFSIQGKLTPVLGVKVKKVEERYLVVFKDTLMNNCIDRELSTRSFH